jgi:hypothetical protein
LCVREQARDLGAQEGEIVALLRGSTEPSWTKLHSALEQTGDRDTKEGRERFSHGMLRSFVSYTPITSLFISTHNLHTRAIHITQDLAISRP